jgi:hypothetical protein
VVEHAGYLVTVRRIDADSLLEDLAHRGRHCPVDLEPHRLAEATSPQLGFECQHQVVGLVLLKLEIGVARNPEQVSLEDGHS